jgi:5-methylcytosine-specific restriction endonuclease McrA
MRFCGKACGTRWWVQNNRERRKVHAQRRNAKERGAQRTLPVDRREIFARDNWTCGLCREKVDAALKFPHRMSATLDHIVPLSKGGSHEPSNVQLAHFVCNCRKKDRAA